MTRNCNITDADVGAAEPVTLLYFPSLMSVPNVCARDSVA